MSATLLHDSPVHDAEVSTISERDHKRKLTACAMLAVAAGLSLMAGYLAGQFGSGTFRSTDDYCLFMLIIHATLLPLVIAYRQARRIEWKEFGDKVLVRLCVGAGVANVALIAWAWFQVVIAVMLIAFLSTFAGFGSVL